MPEPSGSKDSKGEPVARKTRSRKSNSPVTTEAVEEAEVLAQASTDDAVPSTPSPDEPVAESDPSEQPSDADIRDAPPRESDVASQVGDADPVADVPITSQDPADAPVEHEAAAGDTGSAAGEQIETPAADQTDNPVEDLITTDDDPRTADVAEQTVIPQAIVAPVAEKKSGGVMGRVVGGALAAAIGFGAAQIYPDGWPIGGVNDEIAEQIAAQNSAIQALQTTIAGLETQIGGAATTDALAALGVGVSEVDARVSTLGSQLSEQIAAQVTQSAQNAEQIGILTKRPIAENTDEATAAAVAAFGQDVAGFGDQVAALRLETQRRVEEMNVLINDTAGKEAAAAAAAQSAADAARLAVEARAVVDVRAALETGTPFGDPLAVISSVAVPDALMATMEAGAPTRLDLREALPPLARSALTASLKDTVGEDMGGRFQTFVRTQLGARSLAPRDGDDPDAVLSRVEAAIASDNLELAIETVSSLPQSGQDILAPWVAQVQMRLDALVAADMLADSLTSN
ncbi:MAG: hypothetical protein ACI9IV_000366 [Paracoccaceae bacterium]|jgi:hypothetical protein